MFIWSTKFSTARPMSTMPRLQYVVEERQESPDYHYCGRYRQSEGHCLFKYTLSGEGVFLDASGEHRVPQGHGFLCKIFDPAAEYYYPKDGHAPWEFVYACFEGGTVNDIVEELVRRHGPVYKLDLDSPVMKRMLAMRGDGAEEMDVSAGESAGLVFELLTSLEASKSGPGGAKDAGAELVRKAKRRIEESMPGGMPIGELAAELEVSREHLSRVFMRETGSTPHNYMTRARMRQACRLLKESPMDVKEIGDLLGIDVPQHFTRLFKKTMKMTPTQFRLHGMAPNF